MTEFEGVIKGFLFYDAVMPDDIWYSTTAKKYKSGFGLDNWDCRIFTNVELIWHWRHITNPIIQGIFEQEMRDRHLI